MSSSAYNIAEIPLILTVPELAELLGIGRNAAYSLVNSSQIQVVKIGRTIRIPRHAVLAYLGVEVA